LKIAIYSVIRLSNGAGGERWIEQIATRLKKKNIEVTVITTKYGAINNLSIIKNLAELDVNILELDHYRFLFRIPKIQTMVQIANIMRNTDVLYFNNAFALNEVLIYILKKITKIKVVSGYHGTFPETGSLFRQIYHRLINRAVSKGFDAHHVMNKERESQIKSWGYSRVFRIPNGVDVERFSPREKSKETFNVLFVGTMNYQKGIDRFAKMVERVNSQEPQKIRFIIVGSGNLSHVAKNLQSKYDNVSYNDFVDDQVLAELYSTCHVLVTPSRYEEFGIVILEANASGTPVIASNLSGPRELIKNGINGVLVDSDVIDHLVDALFHLINLWRNNPAEYQKYRINARLISLAYEWSHVSDQIVEMFKVTTDKNYQPSNTSKV
jgi:1,2-diacylglycerol-3-alpha-glucose alpha-1,2-glucosyltransferase